MGEQKYTTTKVRVDIHERLKAIADTRKMDIQEVVNDTLLMNLEKWEYLKEWAPNFSYQVEDDKVIITDAKVRRIFYVRLTDHQPYCDDDKSTNCIHVQFALATPELAKIWLNRKG